MNQNLYVGLKNVKICDIKESNGCLKICIQSILPFGICPACKNPSSSVRQYRSHPIIDRPVTNIQLSMSIIKRQFRCLISSCPTKTFTEEIEGLPKKHTYTKEFENFLVELFDHMDHPTIHKHLTKFNLFIPSSTISYKLKDAPIQFQLSLQDVQNARYIGIDEFSYSKGHSFGVLSVNIDKHKIADMVAGGRDQRTAEAALRIFNPATVEACAIDMHEPFKNAVQNKLPNAVIVVDKFHVVKLLNEAIKDLIKRIFSTLPFDLSQQKDFNKKGKWIILSAIEKLSPAQRTELSSLLSLNQELKTIHEFKESFRTLYRTVQNYDIAYEQLHQWLRSAKASNIPELIHVSNTYTDWFTFILNYWYHRISNAMIEGKVNKIKVFRRKAYNYRNFHSLRYQVLKSEQYNFKR